MFQVYNSIVPYQSFPFPLSMAGLPATVETVISEAGNFDVVGVDHSPVVAIEVPFNLDSMVAFSAVSQRSSVIACEVVTDTPIQVGDAVDITALIGSIIAPQSTAAALNPDGSWYWYSTYRDAFTTKAVSLPQDFDPSVPDAFYGKYVLLFPYGFGSLTGYCRYNGSEVKSFQPLK